MCINTLIRPEDQDKYLQEQKEKFTPFITELQMDSKSSPEFVSIRFRLSGTTVSSSCSYFHLFPFQECLEYDKSAESTTKSNSTKVSVISKVCSKEGKWQLRFLFIHTYFKIMYLWLSLRLCQALYLFKSFLILLLTPLPHNIESKN